MCDVCFHGFHVILRGYIVRDGQHRPKNKDTVKEMLKLIKGWCGVSQNLKYWIGLRGGGGRISLETNDGDI